MEQNILTCEFWAGLDAGEKHTSVCVIDSSGHAHLETVVASTAACIDAVLGAFKAHLIRVGIEGGTGSHFVRHLRRMKYEIAVLETRRTRQFLAIRRNKTDTNDARGIAEIVRFNQEIVSEVHVKSTELQYVQSQLTIRESLVKQRMTVDGTIQGVLTLYGGRRISTASNTKYRQRIAAQMDQIQQREGIAISDDIIGLLDLFELLYARIGRLDAKLERFARDSEICQRLMTVPGVGPITAITFYCLIEEPSRFWRAENVAPYLGLVPLIHQSGSLLRKGRISRMGNKRARTLLVTAATCILRTNTADSELKRWGSQIAERAGRRKARIAVARKLAIVMLTMWKRKEDFAPFPKKSVGEATNPT